LLATVTWWAGEEVEARLWLDSARASDLAPADRGYVDGLAAMLDERFDDAAIAFAATQATTGDTAELLYGAFEAHFHGGRVDDAVAAARRLRAIDPGNILPKSHLVDIAAENDDDGFAAFVESAMALTPMERALLGARRLARAGDIAGARALIDAAPRGTPELDVYLDTARCALRAFDARDTSDCRTPIMGDVLVPHFGDTRAIAARAIAVAERAPPFERPRVYELIAAQLPEVGDVDAQRLADAIVALDEGGRRHCPLAVARFTSLAVSSPFAAAYRSLFAAHPTPEDDERVRGLFAGAHATPGATSEVLIALLHAERIAAAGGDPAATCSRVLFSSTLTLPLVSLAPRCAALVASRGTASPALRERLTRWRAER
jgi:tetratricopeptide (TPR) repeat protein